MGVTSTVPPIADVTYVTVVTRSLGLFLFVVAPSEVHPPAPVPAMSMTARWEVNGSVALLRCAWGQPPDHTIGLRWDLSVPDRRAELAHLLEQQRDTEPVTVWLCKSMNEKFAAIGACMTGDEGLLLRSVLGWDVDLDCGPLTAALQYA
jgi:hypothetical protein